MNKKVTTGTVALALAGMSTIAFASPAATQAAEDIPGLPGTVLQTDGRDDIQLDQPGFTKQSLISGDVNCNVATDGIETVALAVEIWQFQGEDNEAVLLESGYLLSDSDFWGGDPGQYFDEAELARWSEIDATPVGKTTGNFATTFVPPSSNGVQFFVGHCIDVEEGSTMEGTPDELPRADAAYVFSYNVTGGEDPDGGDDGNTPTTPAPTTTAPPTTDPSDDDGADPIAPPAEPVPANPNFTG